MREQIRLLVEVLYSNTSNQIVFGTTSTATINVASASNRISTIPNNGGNCNFIMSLNHQAITNGNLAINRAIDTATSLNVRAITSSVGGRIASFSNSTGDEILLTRAQLWGHSCLFQQ